MIHPKKNNTYGFTLVEIMLAMTVFAIIMTSVLLAVENLSIARIKTDNRVKLLEELYFFSEKLTHTIKEGGTLDYEEYWNRKAVGTTILSGSIVAPTTGGYYSGATGVGNYGSGGLLGTNTYGGGLYYCVSETGARMGTGGCLGAFNNGGNGTAPGAAVSFSGRYQRFGQYALQFIDYNHNINADGGDEDGDGSIIDDEDDRDLGNGPIVIDTSSPELYLINPREKTRIFFRHIVYQDTETTEPCTISNTGYLSTGCRGNVQILRMNGLDIGYNHSGSDFGAFDGKVDTWILHPDWAGGYTLTTGDRLATGSGNEWVDLFPNSINVKSLRFSIYPQKDPWLSWDAADCNISSPPGCISPFIHPYVRLEMAVGFAWGKRRAIKGDDPTISVNTTITLGDRE